MSVVRDAIVAFNWFVLAYFLLLNSSYLLLIAVASLDVARWLRRFSFAGHDDIFANPLTPGVSVLVPAYNEELSIVASVDALLALKYPEFEVVVVDDGSTDATFERLRQAFDLRPVERVIPADANARPHPLHARSRVGRAAARGAQGEHGPALGPDQRGHQRRAPAAHLCRGRRLPARRGVAPAGGQALHRRPARGRHRRRDPGGQRLACGTREGG
jgi:cellulose synthase/poly-beta-1,6-N-acetylglucosamine synthase-like glycosyltransferase